MKTNKKSNCWQILNISSLIKARGFRRLKIYMKISFVVKKMEELYQQPLYVMPRNMIFPMSFPIAKLYFSLERILNSRKKDTPANY